MTYEEIARRNKRLFTILETHPNHQQAKYELEQNLERLFEYLSRARHRAQSYQFIRAGPSYKTTPVRELETGKQFISIVEAAEYFDLRYSEVKNNLDKGRFYK